MSRAGNRPQRVPDASPQKVVLLVAVVAVGALALVLVSGLFPALGDLFAGVPVVAVGLVLATLVVLAEALRRRR